ncbi:hypothetical protein [Photorhabdus heterorhabditis]|uniref:hypothetical protein n=1 Tax=Photorhabdus heterorhabditis TaxID=880156 RepID=UPI001BD22CB8|nr:hypothetical protein [Photorhabdus heterorhabditis]MBS9441555.1 hypothetical protein [Photorhabdus heterorhabditis]
MTNRAVIRLNDLTDHGDQVITAIDNYVYLGVPAAAKGELEGMHTACRAKLIVSQKDFLA